MTMLYIPEINEIVEGDGSGYIFKNEFGKFFKIYFYTKPCRIYDAYILGVL